MQTLREFLAEADSKGIALGHFNISDLVAFKAIIEAAQELGVPVLIGTSEGEREFVGLREAAALVRSAREAGIPVFLNADHTHSMEKAKAAVDAGYDEVLFDGGKLPLEENIAQTREVVEYAKSKNKEILVEGELGFIGSSSEILRSLPPGAAASEKDFTSPEEAKLFAEETGVDLLAPAVGNIHGIVLGGGEPPLDIARIGEIHRAAGAHLVLHGGSGTSDADFKAAIAAGIRIVHINTEIRVAWRKGVEAGLAANPDEVAPYKILPPALEGVKKIVKARLALFSDITRS